MLRREILMRSLFWIVIPILIISCSKDDDSNTDPVDVDPTPSAFQGDVDFISSFGGSQTDEAVGVVQATDNGYVVVGTTNSNDGDITDRQGTDKDIWVLKLSEQGEIVWSKTYGGTLDDVATSIKNTADGGFIVSAYSRSTDGDVSGNEGFHDYWILKLDSQGEKQWDRNYGFSGSDQASDVIQTSDGGYFITGFLDVTASNGQGNDGKATQHGVGEFWGIRVNSSGEVIWRRYFGGSNNDRSYSAIQASDGGFLLTGASESEDFDITDSKGSYDFWAVRVNKDGDLLWTKSFGGSEIDISYDAIATEDGNYILVGDSRSSDKDVTNPLGNADVWITKIDDNGEMLWQKSLGGSAFDSARGITKMTDGNFAIVASSRSADGDIQQNNGLNDAWIVIIDENGALQFETNIGGSDVDFALDIVNTQNNELVAVGNSESNDQDLNDNKGSKDFLVMKLK